MPAFSIDRGHRLLTQGDYRRVFARPQRFTSRHFVLLVRPSGCGIARLGLAVAKKHVKLAVGRNRIKRIARESFRHHQDTLTGLDTVVLVRPGISQAPNAVLFAELQELWRPIAAIPR